MGKSAFIFRSRRRKVGRNTVPYDIKQQEKCTTKKYWQFKEYTKPVRRKQLSTLNWLLRREIQGRTQPLAKRKRRSIPFSRLGTSPSEALVGLEGTGSYFVTLQASNDNQDVIFRVYAVPSPAVSVSATRSLAMPLQSTFIPGIWRYEDINEFKPLFLTHCSSERTVLQDTDEPSPLDHCSVRIVTTRDLRIGVAFVSSLPLCHPDDDSSPLGSVAIFLVLNGTSCDDKPVFVLRNVPLRPQKTVRKLVWLQKQVPVHKGATSVDKPMSESLQILKRPGYLILTDEDDGYRLTWLVRSDSRGESNHECPPAFEHWGITPRRSDVVSIVQDRSWERGHLDGSESSTTIEITFESYVRVDALLDDIRHRRQKTFNYKSHHADFSYDLISVKGRFLSLVIVFTNKSMTISVMVIVDVYTQRYKEVEWGKCAHVADKSLSRWSIRLATNRRLEEMRCGPFGFPCLATMPSVRHFDWGMFMSDENGVGTHEVNPLRWKQIVQKLPRSEDKVVKGIQLSFARLYPACDMVVSNDAIRTFQPVRQLMSFDQSVQFVYG